jgi:hypothetical protein
VVSRRGRPLFEVRDRGANGGTHVLDHALAGAGDDGFGVRDGAGTPPEHSRRVERVRGARPTADGSPRIPRGCSAGSRPTPTASA